MQVVSRIRLGLFVPLLLAGLAGCRTAGGKKEGAVADEAAAFAVEAGAPESPTSAPVTLPVGVVHHVDEAARFVLIRSSRGLQLEPGTVLSLHGDGGQVVARVRVGPARKGEFLTADFLEGMPLRNQRVTMEYHRQPQGATGAPPVSGAMDPDAVQVLE